MVRAEAYIIQPTRFRRRIYGPIITPDVIFRSRPALIQQPHFLNDSKLKRSKLTFTQTEDRIQTFKRISRRTCNVAKNTTILSVVRNGGQTKQLRGYAVETVRRGRTGHTLFRDTGTIMFLRPLPWLLLLCGLELFGLALTRAADQPSAAKTLVWGPGLEANVVLPARFFYIQAVDSSGRKWVSHDVSSLLLYTSGAAK